MWHVFFPPEFGPEVLRFLKPPPPDFGAEYFIHYAGISQAETSLIFWLAYLVPAYKCYFLLFGEALPEEVPLYAFDGGENELWGRQHRKNVDREGLKDDFEQNETAGQI